MDRHDATVLFNRISIMPTRLLLQYMCRTEDLLPEQAEMVIHSLARDNVLALVDNKNYVSRRRHAEFTSRDHVNAMVFALLCHFLPDSQNFAISNYGINATFTYKPRNTKAGKEVPPYLIQIIYVPRGYEDTVSAQLLSEPVFEDAPKVLRRFAIMEDPEKHTQIRDVGVTDFVYVDPDNYKVTVFHRRPKKEAWRDIFDV